MTCEYNGIAWHATSNLNNGACHRKAAGTQGGTIVFSSDPASVNTEQYTTTGIGCTCIGGV